MALGPTIIDLSKQETRCKKCKQPIHIESIMFMEKTEGKCFICNYPWIIDIDKDQLEQIAKEYKKKKEKTLNMENPFLNELKGINTSLKLIDDSLKYLKEYLQGLKTKEVLTLKTYGDRFINNSVKIKGEDR